MPTAIFKPGDVVQLKLGRLFVTDTWTVLDKLEIFIPYTVEKVIFDKLLKQHFISLKETDFFHNESKFSHVIQKVEA